MRALKAESLAKRYEEGYGCGEGEGYRSWLAAHDVPSTGRTTRLSGRKVDRQHVVFSDIERNALLAAQRLDAVVDIREQYPLWPLDETLEIAEELGVVHPRHPTARTPVLMTTDLLLTVEDGGGRGLEAIACKPWEELGRVRTLEKLEIERVYWERHQARWNLVTDRDLPKDVILNLLWIDECHQLQDVELDGDTLKDVLTRLPDFLVAGADARLSNACRACDGGLGLKEGSSIKVFRYALSNKIWRVPLGQKLSGAARLPPAVLTAIQRDQQDRVRQRATSRRAA